MTHSRSGTKKNATTRNVRLKRVSLGAALKMRNRQAISHSTKDGVLHLYSGSHHRSINSLSYSCSGEQERKLWAASKSGNLERVQELLAKGVTNLDYAGQGGKTALYAASRRGYVELVKELLAHKPTIDKPSKDGRSALFSAACYGHLPVVVELLEHRAFVDLPRHDGTTALSIASSKGYARIVHALLDRGATVESVDNHGATALHQACQEGYTEVAKALVQRGANGDAIDKKHRTPLILASMHGNIETLAFLIVHGVLLDMMDKDERTAIYLAVTHGHLDAVRLLHEAGAVESTDLEAVARASKHADIGDLFAHYKVITKQQSEALWGASNSGDIAVVRAMLAKRERQIDARHIDGATCLMAASRHGHVDVVQALLEHKADADAFDNAHQSALFSATASGHANIVHLILAYDAKTDGTTPLRLACERGNASIVEALVTHGASVDATSQDGMTGLHWVASHGFLDAALALVNCGAIVDLVTENGTTALMLASEMGHCTIANALLEHKAAVNTADKSGKTALFLASSKGHVEIVTALIHQGANVDCETRDGQTSLFAAIAGGREGVIQVLLDSHANINFQGKDGVTALHFSAIQGNSKLADDVVKHGADPNLVMDDGNTALHVACTKGDMECVHVILSSKTQDLKITNKEGKTALFCAMLEKHNDVAVELINQGADPNVRSGKLGGVSALHLAARLKNSDLASALIKHGADPNLDGSTALHVACGNGDMEFVQVILSSENRNLDIVDNAGLTALLHTIQCGHISIAIELVAQRADPNIAVKDGSTALHLAVDRMNSELTTTLLEHGADPNLRMQNGNTALHISCENGDMNCVRVILSSTKQNLNLLNNEGMTALLSAIQNNHIDIALELVNQNADPNVAGKDAVTPLYLAVDRGDNELASALIEHGANPNAVVKGGNTALHIACEKGDLKCVGVILSSTTQNLNLVNNEGMTALLSAIQNNHIDIALELVNQNADPNVAGKDAVTPLYLAVDRGDNELASALIEHGADPNVVAMDGNCVLHIACDRGDMAWVRLIMSSNKQNLDIMNNVGHEGKTALLTAIKKRHNEIALELVNQGADPNVVAKGSETALHLAVEQGNSELVATLIQKGANPNLTIKNGSTALHYACARGDMNCVQAIVSIETCNLDIVEHVGELTALLLAITSGRNDIAFELVSHGADPNVAGKGGVTALHMTVQQGNCELAIALIEHGADPNLTIENGSSALHLACEMGDLKCAKAILSSPTRNLDILNNDGMTSLLIAIKNNHIDIALELVSKSANPNIAATDGATALHMAANIGNDELVTALVKHGANPNHLLKNGNTALHVACKQGDVKCVQAILDSTMSKLDAVNKEGNTALLVAIKEGHNAIAFTLVNQGADPNVVDEDGATALHAAALKGNSDLVAALLKQGVKEDLAMKDGRTALHVACERDDLKCVQVILSAKNCNLNLVNKEGMTALYHAVLHGHSAIATAVVESGADPYHMTAHGDTSMHLACVKGDMKVVMAILSVRAGNLNTNNKDGLTPLHCAISEGHSAIALALLEKGANADIPTKNGETPLILASRKGDFVVVTALLKHNAMIDATDNVGSTALHTAIKHQRSQIVHFLLKNNANLELKTHDGNTPLMLAIQGGFVDMVQELIDTKVSIDVLDKDGHGALYWAVKSRHLSIVKVLCATGTDMSSEVTQLVPLLGDDAIDIKLYLDEYLKAKNEMVLDIWRAASTGNIAQLRERLAQGVQGMAVSDTDGNTPILIASKGGHAEAVEELLNHGAKVNDTNNDGNTALALAVMGGHAAAANTLLNHHANPNMGNREKKTPLYFAVHGGDLGLVNALLAGRAKVVDMQNESPLLMARNAAMAKVLLDAGSDVNARDAMEYTLLAHACARGDVELAQVLLNHHANIELAGAKKATPLILAAQCGNYNLVCKLLEAGADKSKAAHTGQTAADIAAMNGHNRIAQLLQSWRGEVNPMGDAGDPNQRQSTTGFHSPPPSPTNRIPASGYSSQRQENCEPLPCVPNLSELAALIRAAAPSTRWTLVSHYALCADVIGKSNHCIYKVENMKMPNERLVAKLTDDASEIQFLDRLNNASHNDTNFRHLVKMVDFDQLDLGGCHCHVLILERGDGSCASRLETIQRDMMEPFKCMGHILDGLRDLHGLGYIHGDVKLENVVYFGDAGYKLIDFDHTVEFGMPMSLHWTKEYCPPEMAQCSVHDASAVVASPAFDIWCAAVLILKLFLPGGHLDEFSMVGDNILEKIASPGFSLAASVHKTHLTDGQKKRLLHCLEPNPTLRGSLHDLDTLLPTAPTERKASLELAEIRDSVGLLNKTVGAMHHDIQRTLVDVKTDLMRGIYDATEVHVPTSFILLPYDIADQRADQSQATTAEQVHGFLGHLCAMGSKLKAAVRERNPLVAAKAALDGLTQGQPMYFYLVDDATGTVVEDDADGVYPIKIETKTERYVQFMATNMPLFQRGFQLLKGVNTVAGVLKTLGVPSLSREMVESFGSLLDVKASSVEDFRVVQDALDETSNDKAVTSTRGRGLRELARFFDEHDPRQGYAGLRRTYTDKGCAMWTKTHDASPTRKTNDTRLPAAFEDEDEEDGWSAEME
ncbi:Aste57867_18063 [Aphanomyces stellatus]|uniref:Aste57867_18063 protein n=1 Tax=Aphanomyces stellatus TaxID=120398 RepID=A0A485L9R7_9STRA|nr:hypothetical protein As57867_018001 [Aphanomyces stellatus]VFT94802.1 Aste57867_18063 [Aphanomyces stellatus]